MYNSIVHDHLCDTRLPTFETPKFFRLWCGVSKMLRHASACLCLKCIPSFMKVDSGRSLASEKFSFTAYHKVRLVQLFQILSHLSCMFENIWEYSVISRKKNGNKLWQMASELLLLKLLIFLPSRTGNCCYFKIVVRTDKKGFFFLFS